MFIYIGIFAICFIAAILNDKLKNEKEKRIFEISILIFLCIISGTRYNLGGTDYFVYKTVYDVVPTITEFNFESVQNINGTYGMEKGYLLYNSNIKPLGFSFYCLYIGLKRYIKNFNFFLIIFLYKMFFYDTFISMRQSVSMVIFFIALQFIEKKKPVKYWILCTIALFFHNSAIILFPLYFIRNFKISKKTFMIINIVGLIF